MFKSQMSLNNVNVMIIIVALLFLAPTYAFDITQILGKTGMYSTFNTLITQSGLASEINARRAITVLAVDNAGMSEALGKPMDVVKDLLSLHVILDYFDVPKLYHLNGQTTMLTTLFQASGKARGQQGFLNMTIWNGQVMFSSAGRGSNMARMVKSVEAQPYNISVLHVDDMLVIPIIEPPHRRHHRSPPPPASRVSPAPVPGMAPGVRPVVPAPRRRPSMPPAVAPVGPAPNGWSPTMTPTKPLGPTPPGLNPGRSPSQPAPEGWSPAVSPSGPVGPSPKGLSPTVSPVGPVGPSPKGWSPPISPFIPIAPSPKGWTPPISPYIPIGPSPRGQSPTVSPSKPVGPSPKGWSPTLSPKTPLGPAPPRGLDPARPPSGALGPSSPGRSPSQTFGPSSPERSPSQSSGPSPGGSIPGTTPPIPSPTGWNPTMSPSNPLAPAPPRGLDPGRPPSSMLGPSPGSHAKSPSLGPSPWSPGMSPSSDHSPEMSPSQTSGPSPMNPRMSPPEIEPLFPINPLKPPGAPRSMPHIETKTMPPVAANTPAFKDPVYPDMSPPKAVPAGSGSARAALPRVANMLVIVFLSSIWPLAFIF